MRNLKLVYANYWSDDQTTTRYVTIRIIFIVLFKVTSTFSKNTMQRTLNSNSYRESLTLLQKNIFQESTKYIFTMIESILF